eukprot:355348-Amorphochlora_amoeboformis.AAC.1
MPHPTSNPLERRGKAHWSRYWWAYYASAIFVTEAFVLGIEALYALDKEPTSTKLYFTSPTVVLM